MPFDDLTLLPAFESLRKQGVPLGLSEYLTVLEALRQGYAQDQPEKIEQLCRLVWAKSLQDQELFDYVFARLARPRLEELARQAQTSPQPQEAPIQPDRSLPEDSGRRQGESPLSTDEDELPLEEPEYEQAYLPATAFALSMGWEETGEDLPAFTTARYQLTPRLPLGVREMATAWRHLRLPQRSGPAVELDVEGTLEDISKRGIFLGPRLRPRRRNQADLLVLVDAAESMEPFALLLDTLLESILRVGLLDQVSVFYFQGTPRKAFYSQPSLQGEVTGEAVLSQYAAGRSVLIVSEAGAATGAFDQARLDATCSFLQALEAVTYLYAWLNPLPPERWQGTTAGSIACLVPMFPIDRDGLNDAVSILRGHPFPPDVNLLAGSANGSSA